MPDDDDGDGDGDGDIDGDDGGSTKAYQLDPHAPELFPRSRSNMAVFRCEMRTTNNSV